MHHVTMCAAALALCGAAQVQAQQIDAELFVSGLQLPVFITHAPGDASRMFVLEKPGRIRIVEDGVLLPEPFLDINAIVGGGTTPFNEQGLLGLAFHPDFQNNGLFYIDYTANTDGFGHEDTIIAQYSVDPNDPNKADPNSAVQLLRVDQPFSNHNGGWVGFGPDGYLYIAFGDGGAGNDPGNRAQDITDMMLGKLLRLDVNGDDFPGDPDRNYAIPPDNPFVGVTGDDEIWAYGLRNPWRDSFDRATGDLYIADVGQGIREEIDYQLAADPGGNNYGWRCMEGFLCTGIPGCTCNAPELTLPIYDYGHNDGGPFACAITGGYVYRGCAIADFYGLYIFADFCSDEVFTLRVVDGQATDVQLVSDQLTPDVGDVDNIVSFGEDLAGELYIVDQSDGHIFKIVPADGESDCPTCPADCDDNGELNVLDFICFQNSFADGDMAADCDENGELNILDFLCFQDLFQAGRD